MKESILPAMALLVALVFAACAPLPGAVPSGMETDRPGAGALFRHRWWNFYTRALVAADSRNFETARSDLAAALNQRDRDQRMARTYGMHFIDYFPHRELGVVHWLSGNLTAAETELALSIEQAPSAKARHYLDKVRKARLQELGGKISPPELVLDVPESPVWTREDHIRIRGLAEDPHYVRQITIDGYPLHLDGAQTRVDFTRTLPLTEGCRTIGVEAVNLADTGTKRMITVCTDRLGPSVVLESVESSDTDLTLSGFALDNAGVADLWVNDRRIPANGEPQTVFTLHIPDVSKDVTIQCRDSLGNLTAYQLQRAQWQGAGRQQTLVAGLQMAGLFNTPDKNPPVLRIEDWAEDQTVYMEKVVLTGSVCDRDKVVSFTINQAPVLPRAGALFFFSHILDLEPGDNPVSLVAEDSDGNRTTHRLNIHRKIPKGLLLEERLRLTIFPFEHKGRISAAGFAFQDDFIHEIVQRRRFQVVERQRLELILQEQNINRTQLIDADTALRLGNLAAAQAIVAGSLVETRTGMEIIGRVIDSETGDILCTADVYGEVKTLPGLKLLAKSMSLKIHREFPLVEGRVIQKQGKMIITDLNLEKLRAQRRIVVYTERPVIHPQTRQAMGMDHDVLGTARITQADDKLSKARLQIDYDPIPHSRQRVITR